MVAHDNFHSKSSSGLCMKICFLNASPNDYEKEDLLTFQASGFYFEITRALVAENLYYTYSTVSLV